MKIGLLVGREYSFPPAFIDKVNELGQPHGITGEYVTLNGSPMDEPQRYKVIVDRISHEVEYYRGFLKLAVLNGTYVINNPFWWTADDKFFNYALMARLGVAIPRTVLLPQKAYPQDVDIQPASLRNMGYPLDWDGLLDYVGAAGDPEALLGRRLEARLQGPLARGAAGGLRRHRAVLHDAAAVRALRQVRALLHVRQARHRAGGVRPACPAVPDPARLPVVGGRRARGQGRADDQRGARLRDEHDRVRRSRTTSRTRSTSSTRRPTSNATGSRRSTSRWSSTRWRASASTAPCNGHQSNMFPKWEQMLGLGRRGLRRSPIVSDQPQRSRVARSTPSIVRSDSDVDVAARAGRRARRDLVGDARPAHAATHGSSSADV